MKLQDKNTISSKMHSAGAYSTVSCLFNISVSCIVSQRSFYTKKKDVYKQARHGRISSGQKHFLNHWLNNQIIKRIKSFLFFFIYFIFIIFIIFLFFYFCQTPIQVQQSSPSQSDKELTLLSHEGLYHVHSWIVPRPPMDKTMSTQNPHLSSIRGAIQKGNVTNCGKSP